MAETAVSRHFEEGEIIIARVIDQGSAAEGIVLEQIPDYNFEKSDLAKRLH